MSNRPKPFQNSSGSLSPPELIGVLENIPGGEPDLLPKDGWLRPLRVEFELWTDSVEIPGTTDVMLLILNGDVDNPVDRKEFHGTGSPIDPALLFLEVPVNKLEEGAHSLVYRLIPWNDPTTFRECLPHRFTVDKTAPILATDSKLIFPSEILPPNKLTARYLELHDDEVKARLPAYTAPRPGDRITWYWGIGPGDFNKAGVIVLNANDYSTPIDIVIKGELIRDRGDGPRFVMCQIDDRAGNPSPYSAFVELTVDAKPIPRNLPWPSVEKASGTGQLQTLDPLENQSGAVVVIPDTATIHPGESAWVQWGVPGSVGAHQASRPINAGERRYAIPMPSVAAFIGKTLPVSYFVVESPGKDLPSEERRLAVKPVPKERFPTVQCEGLSGGSLSYARIPDTGARIHLAAWTLMTTDQHIEIRIYGISRLGIEVYHQAIRPRAVSQPELSGGVNATVPKAFFDGLRRDTPLTGRVYVSFDGGTTWPPFAAPNFPFLQLTFTA